MIALLFDKNPEAGNLLQGIVNKANFQSTLSSDIQTAKNLVQTKYYSLILFRGIQKNDLTLLISCIKGSRLCRNAVICLVLENEDPEDIHFYLDAGVDEIILRQEKEDDIYFRILSIQKRIKEKKYYEADFNKNQLSLAEFKVLTDTAPDGIITINQEGIILSINKAVTAIFGYEESELIGTNIKILMPEPYKSSHDEYLKSYMDGNPPQIIGIGRDVEGLKKDGTIFPVRLAVNEIDYNNTKIFLGIIQDITERKLIEEKLKLAEKYFRDQYKGIPYPISTWKWVEDDFVLIDYNEAAFNFTKGNINSKLNRKFKEIYDRPEIYNLMNEAYSGKKNITKEINQTNSVNNELQNLIVNIVYIPPDMLIIHSIDVTEKKKMEIALKESELRYRSVIEDQSEYILRFSYDGVITFANHAAFKEFKIPELIGSNFYSYLNREELEELKFNFITVAPESPVFEFQTSIFSSSASEKWERWIIRAIYNSENRITEFQAVGRDITLIRLSQILLRQKEEQLRKITDNLPVYIAYIDKEEHYQFVNQSYVKLFNKPKESILGMKVFDLLGSKGYPQKYIQEVLSGNLVQFENNIRMQNREMWFSIIYIPDIDNSGEIKGFYSLITDITGQKSSQIDLLKAREEADRANNAKSVFLANMSHELRTPLNSILGYAQILSKDNSLNNYQHKAVNAIINSGEYLLMLITDILDLSKIEANRLDLQLYPFLFNDLFNEIIEFISPGLNNKDISFQYMIPDEKIELIGDKKRIQQILLNLLSNAIKFTKQGYIYFLSDITKIDKNECEIVFRVKDTGIGLEENQIKEIFHPFQQFGSAALKEKGTGLGLATSMKLAKLMNSEIFVESTPGKGSLFYFKLRLRYIPLNAEEQNPPAISLSGPQKVLIEETNLVFPKKELLLELKELAEKGEYTRLLKKCNDIRNEDRKFHPFAEVLEKYLDNFEFEKIIQLIRSAN